MKKLGILVDNLGASQLAFYTIMKCNQLAQEGVIPYVFYENLTKTCLIPRFPIMHVAETYGFDAPCIATSFSTAQKLVNAASPTKKAFYVWDLEWLRFKEKTYEGLQAVYGNKELELWCRGQTHKTLVGSAWNRYDIKEVHNFDLEAVKGFAK